MLWSSASVQHNDELNLFIADLKVKNVFEKEANKMYLQSYKKVKILKKKKLHFKDEKHLINVQQLTFGGQNAEGYFG